MLVSMFCLICLLFGSIVLPAKVEQLFDPVYYAVAYLDVVAVFGMDHQALLNHYLQYGINNNHLPYEGATPGIGVSGLYSNTMSKFEPIYYAAI